MRFIYDASLIARVNDEVVFYFDARFTDDTGEGGVNFGPFANSEHRDITDLTYFFNGELRRYSFIAQEVIYRDDGRIDLVSFGRAASSRIGGSLYLIDSRIIVDLVPDSERDFPCGGDGFLEATTPGGNLYGLYFGPQTLIGGVAVSTEVASSVQQTYASCEDFRDAMRAAANTQ
ncbi:hypothetical protein J2T57_001478 [Natronocella acetinitrilica]|uniref:Uncharacterized protein n=2 Tax=Natronocella acetinitrilica TaxID=414046 RepID=A0AAE3KB89_9GAMM|nr:hypothetical protein [Natronocella acetinitrilica]